MELQGFFDFISNDKVIPVVISSITTIVVFFLTLMTKNYVDTRILNSKLDAEHKFEQRKKIKEVLAKHKIHLLIACEDFNHRMWNFSNNYSNGWLNINGSYLKEHYYFHSFVYRLLSIFAWVKEIQKEMVFLDTTIAGKEDLEFVKFINIFSRMFCDLTFLEGIQADGNKAYDHFYRNEFDLFSDTLIKEHKVKSYAEYMDELTKNKAKINKLFIFFDGLSPNESRKRWDRLHFFHLTILIFLNTYGYDYQRTDEKKLERILNNPKKSDYLDLYFAFFKSYHLNNHVEVKKLEKIASRS